MGYKHDYDKAMSRLTVILQKLYEGESLSVKDLAEEFGTSTRTIQRDFNEKLIQFPIIKDGKKWKMRDGFHVEKLKSVEDQLVLNMLETFSENLGNIFSQRAKNILSKMKNPDISHIYASLDIEDIGSYMSSINTIEKAILEKAIITCKYHIGSKVYDITIKPLKIANFEGFWYLIALDNRNDKLKKYHLKSINDINITDKHFTRLKELDEPLEHAINIWFNIENEPTEVVLHVEGKIAHYFQRKPISKSQIISSINSEDGSIELSIKITHAMEIIPTILHWLPNIEVLEPKWLKDEIIETVEKYLNKTKNF